MFRRILRYFALEEEEKQDMYHHCMSLRRTRAIALLFVMIAALGGCDWWDGRVELAWSEEVRLYDGTLIVVERAAQGKLRHEFGSPGSGGWESKEMTLQIPAAVAGGSTPPVWRTGYVPILLDYDNATATWSVIATFGYCTTWNDLGRPDSPYLEFQSRAGGPWQRVDLEPSRIGQAANLLRSMRATGEASIVREEEKKIRDERVGEIYRKIVTKWENNCLPLRGNPSNKISRK